MIEISESPFLIIIWPQTASTKQPIKTILQSSRLHLWECWNQDPTKQRSCNYLERLSYFVCRNLRVTRYQSSYGYTKLIPACYTRDQSHVILRAAHASERMLSEVSRIQSSPTKSLLDVDRSSTLGVEQELSWESRQRRTPPLVLPTCANKFGSIDFFFFVRNSPIPIPLLRSDFLREVENLVDERMVNIQHPSCVDNPHPTLL
jgi:hypothetical protein